MARKVPFQRTIVDAEGNVVPGAKLRVQRAISGTPLAPIYDGPTGVQINNPADPPGGHETDGFVQVYVPAGFYTFTPLSADGTTIIGTPWENVPMGDAAAYDAEDLQSGVNLNIVGEWDGGTTYAAGEDVTYSGLVFRSLADANLNNEPATDPPASDANWSYIAIEARVTGTSVSSVTTGTGAKNFVTQAGLGWGVGTRLRATPVSDPSAWVEGPVTGYGGSALVMNAEITGAGSGTFDSWVISLAGEQGADGTDPGALMTFQDAVTEDDPGSGNLQFNNADISAGDKLMVSDTNRAGDDVSEYCNGAAAWGIAGSRALGILTKSGSTDQAIIDVTVVSNETGYTEYTYAFRGGVTAFTDEDAISLQLVPYGPAGNDGVFSGTQTVLTDAANAITAAMSGRTLIADRATAIAFNFDDAATLGSTWSAIIKNENAGTLTLEPDGAETIDGEANMTLAEGASLVVHCDGTNLRTVLAGVGISTPVQANDDINTVSSNIASASTTDLSTATGVDVTITGTTTITAFGTEQAGAKRFLAFSGALTLTHNASSLILFGENITTAAGDTAIVQSLGSGNWRCLNYQRAGAVGIKQLALIDATNGGADDLTEVSSTDAALAGAKRIKILFQDWSLSGTDSTVIEIGSGSYATSGYASGGAVSGTGGSLLSTGTSGFIIRTNGAANIYSGTVTLDLADAATNLWVESHCLSRTTDGAPLMGGGSRAISGALDRIKVKSSGTDTIDGGNVGFLIEY